MIVQGSYSVQGSYTFPRILHVKVLSLCFLSDAFNICDGNNAVTSSAANRYVEALSDIICWGTDLRAANPRYARTKVCTENSITTTRWTTLVVAHVKKQMLSFFWATASRMYKALVKSTSVTVNFSA